MRNKPSMRDDLQTPWNQIDLLMINSENTEISRGQRWCDIRAGGGGRGCETETKKTWKLVGEVVWWGMLSGGRGQALVLHWP